MPKDVDFRNLLEENYERDMREQEWSDEEDSVDKDLDPGFSSWADYYHYKFG